MSADYTPGTPAMVQCSDGEWRAAIFGYRQCGEAWTFSDGSYSSAGASVVRPFIALDLSPHHVMRTLEALRESRGLIALEVADLIEAQARSVRIPEPGLWGVVEAHVDGIPRRRWVHHEEDRWVCDTGERRFWEDLIDPELVREGVA